MRKLFSALVSAVVLFCAAYAAELDPLLRDGAEELWKMSGESVVRAVPDTFTWMDQAHSRLRFNARTSRKILSLFGRNVQEAIFDFRGGRVVSLSVSVYTAAMRAISGRNRSRRCSRSCGNRSGTSPARSCAP